MRLKIITQEIKCKNCGSPRIVKYGHYRENQLWLCRDCGKKFTDTNAVVHGKLPSECVTYALGAYYDGMSINAIRRNLKQQYDVYPSSDTVFSWIQKYSHEATELIKNFHPKVGDTWIADETYVRIDQRKRGNQLDNPYEPGKKGKWIIFWDIIDADTRFLLASVVATTRTAQDAKKLMELAEQKAGKTPKVVVTDALRSYIEGIEQAYGSETEHRQGSPFDLENNTNLIERFHSTLKERTKVMRALRNKETTQTFTDGWLFYYNFLKPHMSLDNRTPAQEAKLAYPLKDWSDIVKPPETKTVQVEVVKTETPKPINPRIRKPKVHHRRSVKTASIMSIK
jgi:putative transposase